LDGETEVHPSFALPLRERTRRDLLREAAVALGVIAQQRDDVSENVSDLLAKVCVGHTGQTQFQCAETEELAEQMDRCFVLRVRTRAGEWC
jgi:hypothetical protein